MFKLFFIKYKVSFRKAHSAKMTKVECIFLGIFLVSSCTILLSPFIEPHLVIYGISLLVLLIDSVAIKIYRKVKSRQQIDEKTQLYKDHIIDPLTALLKKPIYNLYNIEGLTWLIDCCAENIKPKPSTLLGPIIFSIFTLAYGLILKDISGSDIIFVTTKLILLIAIIVPPCKYVSSFIVEYIRNPDKDLYQYLKSELEYILVQLKSQPPSSGNS